MIHSWLYLRTLIPFFVGIWMSILTPFVVAKIFIWDSRLSLKEGLFLFFAPLLIAVYRIFPNIYRILGSHRYAPPGLFMITTRVLIVLILFIYFYKIKGRPPKISLILAIFADLVAAVSFWLTNFILIQFFGTDPFFTGNPMQTLFDFFDPMLDIIISVGIALLIVKIVKRFQKTFHANNHLQTVFMVGSLIGWLSYHLVSFSYLLTNLNQPALWLSLLLFGYITVALLSFFFYFQHQNAKSTIKQQKAEQKNLLFYMDEIEEQQTSMRNFKHDYQNILISFEDYINENDFTGLKAYYFNRIKATSEIMAKNDFTLSSLSHIKVREAKGLLRSKLVRAQNLNLDVRLEVTEDIEYIFVDSVILVRMLGILLDNAVEELESLGNGTLQVACFKENKTVIFVIENTCRTDMPTIYQLRQKGFSSKGKDRGLGLSILAELVNGQANITLQTSLPQGRFIQKLTIGEQ